MIYSVNIKDRNKLFNKYVSDIKLPKSIEFTPGLNVIIGPNGCGKTTLINILKKYTFCDKQFYSVPDIKSIKNLSVHGGDFERIFQDGADVKCNYTIPCFNLRFSDEMEQHDYIDNMVNFKQTFYDKNSSTGEGNWFTFNQLMTTMFEENHISGYDIFKYMNEDKIKKYYNDNQKDDYIFTIFMDEPDKSLDIDKLIQLYNIITFPRTDTQLIIILHNPLLIYKLYKESKCNFIEFEEGYLNRIINFIEHE